MTRIHALVAGCIAVVLAGCGQKGPLVLPDAAKAHKKVPRTTPAPAAVPETPTGATPATESSASPSTGATADPTPSQP